MKLALLRALVLMALAATLSLLASCCDNCNPVTDNEPDDTASSDSAFFTFGGTNPDRFLDIIQTPDGGFAMVGVTASFGDGSQDIYLVKIDAFGDTTWTKNIGGSADEVGNDLVVTPDGGFAIVGWQNNAPYLVKTDSEGNVVWQRTYEGYRGQGIVNAPDGGFAFTHSGGGISVVKTDAEGNIEWQTTWSEYTSQYGRSLVCTPDGGYAASGDVFTSENYGIDIVVMRLSGTGETLWIRRLEAPDNSWGEGITNVSGGGFVVTGMSESYQCGLFKLDDSGDVVWSRGFGCAGHTEGYAVVELSDGGFAVTGDIFGRNSDNDITVDFFLAKTDENGNALWMRTLGGAEEDRGMSLVAIEENRLAVVGYGSSCGAGDFDAYLYLTDEDGQVLSISDE